MSKILRKVQISLKEAKADLGQEFELATQSNDKDRTDRVEATLECISEALEDINNFIFDLENSG